VTAIRCELHDELYPYLLRIQTCNALARAGIETVAQLRAQTHKQLLEIRGIGTGTADEVEAAVTKLGGRTSTPTAGTER
jgi:DNA-directed RNA polymerase alpha subunit